MSRRRNAAINHGTLYAYRTRKCRCEECRTVYLAATVQYRRECGMRPMNETGNPCEKDGILYPSQRAAARALGITDSAVEYHLARYGNLDRVGGPRSHTKGGGCVPIKLAGREWPSRVAFADWLGVPITTVRGWLRRGDTDRLMGALMKADAKAAALQMRDAA